MAINSQPVIILVEPQLGENIGMCARAMLNCGLQRLRLVNPRQGWPNKAATATAADADIVLKEIEMFVTLDEALNDCQRVFATTARDRSLNVPQLNVTDAVVEAKKGIAVVLSIVSHRPHNITPSLLGVLELSPHTTHTVIPPTCGGRGVVLHAITRSLASASYCSAPLRRRRPSPPVASR